MKEIRECIDKGLEVSPLLIGEIIRYHLNRPEYLSSPGYLLIGSRVSLLQALHLNEIKSDEAITCDCPIGHISNKIYRTPSTLSSSSLHHHSKVSNYSIDSIGGISNIFTLKMDIDDDDEEEEEEVRGDSIFI